MWDKDFELNKQTLPVVEQMAQRLPGGFVLYKDDEAQEILFVNDVLLDMYGCRNLEEFRSLTGYSFPGMVCEEDRAWVLDSINAQIAGVHGANDHVEYRIVTKNGDVRWIDDYGHFSHSQDYGNIFYVFLFDITEKKQALEAKSNFYFEMSHQLLTPMNAVSTFIKLARSHKDQPDALELYLEGAEDAARHMVEEIDRLVEIHRRSRGGERPSARADGEIPLRILVAEDNELNQMMIRTILEESGFLVEMVDDGDKAVEAVRDRGPAYYDAVLMDIRMNRMDGYEATRQIRAIPGAEATALPILAVSANSRDEDIAESIRSGMNEHMAKHYDPEQIIATIYRYAKR